MKTYHENKADTALTVKSIKVLENIEGGGITEIRHDVNAVRQQQIAQNKKQDAYWEALSSDGIVSAVEKQGLLREMENITRSEAAILSQAATYGYTGLVLQDFIATYEDLRDYLYVTLKLFDDMNEDTAIDDRTTFNTKFSQYYFEENFVLLAITAGILDTINFRVLQSLNESGTEGEIAIYRGAIYQFKDGLWKDVTTGAYKGPRNEIPERENGAFFLVSESFTTTDVLYVNDEEFYVNGDVLGITRTFIRAMIYYCRDGVWLIEENTKDWKYAAAFADIINLTGELPEIFQATLDELQAEIDDLQAHNVMHVPAYLGASSIIPTGQEGDFFVYSGGSTGNWIKSMVYKYTNGSWGTALDPRDTANRHYYMMALEDILAMNVTGDGYFSTIFAYAFFGNAATLESLSVRTIYLHSDGIIQSDLNTYSPEQTGIKIDADGNIDANENVHIKGKCAIGVPLYGNTDFNTYDVVIGGNTKFSGHLDGASGEFQGTLRGGYGYFKRLGFYAIGAGPYVIFTERKTFNTSDFQSSYSLSKTIRITPCLYESRLRINVALYGAGGGDTYAKPSVRLFIKLGDDITEHVYNTGYSGTTYIETIERDIQFYSPTDYVDVIVGYTVVGIPIPPKMEIQLKSTSPDPLIGRFAIFDYL